MRNTARQTRENRTITVDFQNEATSFQLLADGRTFVEKTCSAVGTKSVAERYTSRAGTGSPVIKRLNTSALTGGLSNHSVCPVVGCTKL